MSEKLAKKSEVTPLPLALTAPPVAGVAGVHATGLITYTGIPTAGQTTTINGRVYTYQGSGPLGPNDILIGADVADQLLKTKGVITPFFGGDPHDDVTAAIISGSEIRLTAIVSGTGGNAITLSESATNVEVSGEYLSGGADEIPGTPGTLGQLAIVTTTNASGTFEDVWTCSNLSPMTWQPPGQITRSPDGTLYRATVSNAGVIGNELAYP